MGLTVEMRARKTILSCREAYNAWRKEIKKLLAEKKVEERFLGVKVVDFDFAFVAGIPASVFVSRHIESARNRVQYEKRKAEGKV